MPRHGAIEEWVAQKQHAELFRVSDVQAAFPDKSLQAVRVALARLANRDDSELARAMRGVYCRVDRAKQADGSLPLEAEWRLQWFLAGPGAGRTELSIINRLGWSTQIPMIDTIAMLGKPPTVANMEVVFRARSNRKRVSLNVLEIGLLEAVRCFDEWAEIPWEKALSKYSDYSRTGAFALPVRYARCLEAAHSEPPLLFDKSKFIELLEASNPG